MDKHNLALLCDYYEYTMANGYHLAGIGEKQVYFDLYFRTVPDGGGFAIAAGLWQVIEYIRDLHFDESDIAYLAAKGVFSDSWLDMMRGFKFEGDIYAVPEGTPIFPNEPIITVRAKAEQAQIIETFLLICVNHQSLIATKTSRIVRAADGRTVMEFGARRAQGASAAYMGARAAYIAGVNSTSDALSDKLFGIPAAGTMAHSWVQIFDDEYTAFKTYAELYPHGCSLLVDTYNVLKSGVPNAIHVFKEILLPQGIRECSIRIDSGDITYLSRKARQMLDDAGLTHCQIIASNSLDENIIRDLINQGGRVDGFGVGERLITAKSDPVFGGVYKLVAVENEQGEVLPKIKISENVTKITTPHFKRLYRLYENETGKAIADYICVHDETLDGVTELELFDPQYTWKKKTVTNFTARELMIPIFLNGKQVYASPHVEQIRAYCLREIDNLWDEVKRFENPHNYYVDLSRKLWSIKNQLLDEHGSAQ